MTNSTPLIALIDGLVDKEHPCFNSGYIKVLALCKTDSTAAMNHATSVASTLVGTDSKTLGLCKGSRLLNIGVVDSDVITNRLSITSLDIRLARSIIKAVRLSASVIQIGMEFSPHIPFPQTIAAVRFAAAKSIRTIIPSGNNGLLGQNPLLSTAGAVPVASADLNGKPSPGSGLGLSVGIKGFLAPGEMIPVATIPNSYSNMGGSSFAASFVTSAFVLLYMSHPDLEPDRIWNSLFHNNYYQRQKLTIVPPLLDLETAKRHLESTNQINRIVRT